jgi:hypothetical protein
MRARLAMSILTATVAASGCDLSKVAVNSTSKVLAKAQPSLRQEADFEMAARAIPASLKTVEGFHVAHPGNKLLPRILAEGYCQYGTGFIEDEWEVAMVERDFDAADYHARRATKAFLRCMGYALVILGDPWGEVILADVERVKAQAAQARPRERDGMLFLAMGLASAINMNKDDVGMVAHAPKVGVLLQRVIELDDKTNFEDRALRALPHVAMGMLNTAIPPALGGQPEVARTHFERAIEITDNKFLLAKVLFARRYAVAVQDQELFRDTLVGVLQTDPAIWPDQRLANEIAHRRARRYLKQEKEWF